MPSSPRHAVDGLRTRTAYAPGHSRVFHLDRYREIHRAVAHFGALIVMLTTNRQGVTHALRVRSQAAAMGVTQTLLLSVSGSALCERPRIAAESADCGWSVRLHMQPPVSALLRSGITPSKWQARSMLLTRVYVMARLFRAGSSVLQIDTDVAWLSSPFPLIAAAENLSMVVQSDNKLGNGGLVYAHRTSRHGANKVTEWFLGEWYNRMLGWAADEQQTLQDVMATAAIGHSRSEHLDSPSFPPSTRSGQAHVVGRLMRDRRDAEFTAVLRRGCAFKPCDSAPLRATMRAAGSAMTEQLRREALSDPVAKTCSWVRQHLSDTSGRGFDALRGFTMLPPAANETSVPPLSRLALRLPPLPPAAVNYSYLPQPRISALSTAARATFWIAPAWLWAHWGTHMGAERRCAASLDASANVSLPSTGERSSGGRAVDGSAVQGDAVDPGSDPGSIAGSSIVRGDTVGQGGLARATCSPVGFLHLSGYPIKGIRGLILQAYMPQASQPRFPTHAPPLLFLDGRTWARGFPPRLPPSGARRADAIRTLSQLIERHVFVPMVGLALATGRKLVLPTLPPGLDWTEANGAFNRLPVGCARRRSWLWLPFALGFNLKQCPLSELVGVVSHGERFLMEMPGGVPAAMAGTGSRPSLNDRWLLRGEAWAASAAGNHSLSGEDALARGWTGATEASAVSVVIEAGSLFAFGSEAKLGAAALDRPADSDPEHAREMCAVLRRAERAYQRGLKRADHTRSDAKGLAAKAHKVKGQGRWP